MWWYLRQRPARGSRSPRPRSRGFVSNGEMRAGNLATGSPYSALAKLAAAPATSGHYSGFRCHSNARFWDGRVPDTRSGLLFGDQWIDNAHAGKARKTTVGRQELADA